MLKYALTMLCAVTVSGIGVTLTTTHAADQAAAAETAAPPSGCPSCGQRPDDIEPIVMADVAATAPATQKAAAVDVKNTKCLVTEDAVGDETVEIKGKIYHLCCSDCAETIKKDPDKYIKAFEANPAKYGVKK